MTYEDVLADLELAIARAVELPPRIDALLGERTPTFLRTFPPADRSSQADDIEAATRRAREAVGKLRDARMYVRRAMRGGR